MSKTESFKRKVDELLWLYGEDIRMGNSDYHADFKQQALKEILQACKDSGLAFVPQGGGIGEFNPIEEIEL